MKFGIEERGRRVSQIHRDNEGLSMRTSFQIIKGALLQENPTKELGIGDHAPI